MRLIDADALGVGRCSRDVLPADYCAGWNGLIRLLEKAPTVDAVPVVHCRECKHYVAGYCCRDINGRTNMFRMFDNDFCSYGERMADE